MLAYIVRRLLIALPSLLGISLGGCVAARAVADGLAVDGLAVLATVLAVVGFAVAPAGAMNADLMTEVQEAFDHKRYDEAIRLLAAPAAEGDSLARFGWTMPQGMDPTTVLAVHIGEGGVGLAYLLPDH